MAASRDPTLIEEWDNKFYLHFYVHLFLVYHKHYVYIYFLTP